MRLFPREPTGWLYFLAVLVLAAQVGLDDATWRAALCALGVALGTVGLCLPGHASAIAASGAANRAPAADLERAGALATVLAESRLAGVLILDPAGRVLAASAAARELLGDDALVGRPVETLVVGVGAPLPPWPWSETRLAVSPVAKRERVAWIETRGWQAPEGPRHVVVLQDRTEAEEAQRAAEAAREEALLAAQVRAEFLANISHEIRTPMNGVLGMLALLREEGLQPDQLELVDHTHRSATALLGIVNDLLDISRLTSGAPVPMESVEFDALTLVEDVCALLYDARRDPRVSLVVEADAHLDRNLVGDAGRLRQIVNNLVSNAIKFTRRGHVTARVTTRRDDDGRATLSFIVEDTGIGIARENLEVIFERFRQVDGSMSRRYGGAGLGLAIARELARNMSGEITVASEPGTGSTFTFSCSLRVAAGSRGPDLRGRSVLVATMARVEGDALAANLRGHGAECRTTSTTEELIAALPGVDVLVADGALLADARRRGVVVGVPLILLTSAQEAARDGAAEPGALRLAKPIRPSRAALVVLAALEGARAEERPAASMQP